MQVEYGGGGHTIILAPGNIQRLWAYGSQNDPVEKCHQGLGGNAYYTSRSGASGAGNIDLPGCLSMAGHRTDTRGAQYILPATFMPGCQASIPYIYGQGIDYSDDAMAVLVMGGVTYLCSPNSLLALLGNQYDERDWYRPVNLEWTCWRNAGGPAEKVVRTVHLRHRDKNGSHSYCRGTCTCDRVDNMRAARRTAEMLYHVDLEFSCPDGIQAQEFWRPLGMVVPAGAGSDTIYKVSRGIARSATPLSTALASRESLQSIVRQGVVVLHADGQQVCVTYPGPSGVGPWVIAYLRIVSGEMQDYHLYVNTEPAVLMQLLSIDTVQIERQMRILGESCDAKYRRHDPPVSLSSIDAELVVRAADIPANIACRPGIDAWIERHMPGRTECTVAELLPHAGHPDVHRILQWVARLQRAEATKVERVLCWQCSDSSCGGCDVVPEGV